MSLEDFGIAPVEAMAAGAPVIGFGRGGLLDTVRCASGVVDQPTGLLFGDQTVASLVQALEWFEEQRLWLRIRPEYCRRWAERFRPEAFASRFETAIRQAWSAHKRGCAVGASDPAEMPGLRL